MFLILLPRAYQPERDGWSKRLTVRAGEDDWAPSPQQPWARPEVPWRSPAVLADAGNDPASGLRLAWYNRADESLTQMSRTTLLHEVGVRPGDWSPDERSLLPWLREEDRTD